MPEPKFFIHKNTRHLVMTFEWFKKNEDLIASLLEVYYFDDKKEVTRIEDEDSNFVEFVQPIEGDDDEYTDCHIEGARKRPYH